MKGSTKHVLRVRQIPYEQNKFKVRSGYIVMLVSGPKNPARILDELRPVEASSVQFPALTKTMQTDCPKVWLLNSENPAAAGAIAAVSVNFSLI